MQPPFVGYGGGCECKEVPRFEIITLEIQLRFSRSTCGRGISQAYFARIGIEQIAITTATYTTVARTRYGRLRERAMRRRWSFANGGPEGRCCRRIAVELLPIDLKVCRSLPSLWAKEAHAPLAFDEWRRHHIYTDGVEEEQLERCELATTKVQAYLQNRASITRKQGILVDK